MRSAGATVTSSSIASELRTLARRALELAEVAEREDRPAPVFVTLEQAALRVGVTPRQLRAHRANGRLPAVREGKAWRVRMEDVLALYQPRAARVTKAERLSEDDRLRAALAKAGVQA